MANWLEEMIQRVLAGGGEPHPGYTPNRMMANQGPMGTPTQDPAQFGVPYQTPYGQNSVLRQSDVENGPFGIRDVERQKPGARFGEKYTAIDGPWMNAPVMSDSLNSRLESAGYDERVSPYDVDPRLHGASFLSRDALSTGADARGLLSDVGRGAAENKLRLQMIIDALAREGFRTNKKSSVQR